MSESKVPLPSEHFVDKDGLWDERFGPYSVEELKAYGDARAAEARRLALLEAATHVYMVKLEATGESADDLGVRGWLAEAEQRLRALADDVSLPSPPASPPPHRPPSPAP